MTALVRLALGRRTVTLLVAGLVLLLGANAAGSLQQELFPSIQPPFLVVSSTQPGASPGSVADGLTEPIEEAVRSSGSVESVQSTSAQGVAVVFAEYAYGTDVEQRQREIRDTLAEEDLPDEASDPEVRTVGPDDLPIYSIAVTGDEAGPAGDAVREVLAPQIEQVDGVADVSTGGAAAPVIDVTIDPEALADESLTVLDVVGALEAADLSVPVGAVEPGQRTLPVRVTDPLGGVGELDELIVGSGPAAGAAAPGGGATPPAAGGEGAPPTASGEGAPPQTGSPPTEPAQPPEPPEPVRLADVAEVETTREEGDTIARFDGRPAATLDVFQAQDANTVDTIAAVEDAIAGADVPDRLDIEVVVNQGPEISSGVSDVTRDAVLGALLAIVMVAVFLRSARGTVVAGVSIPLSLIAALALMNGTGVTLNILTLGALAVAAGRVIDDAIVVLENIYRRLELGEPRMQAVREGTREVAGAVTSATLTAVAVFLPLAFISGLVGEVFVGFALTTTFALLASLVVSLTVVPTLGSLLLRRSEAERADPEHSPLRRLVRRPLGWALRHRAAAVGLAVVALLASLGSLVVVPVTLFPTTEAENLLVSAEAETGTALEATAERVAALEERIDEVDGVASYATVVGSAGSGGFGAVAGGGASNAAEVTVEIADDVEVDAVRTELESALEASELDGSVTEQSAIPIGSEIAVAVSGDDFAAVSEVSEDVVAALEELDSLIDVDSNVAETRDELVIELDDEAAAERGLDATSLSQLLRASLNPVPVTEIEADGEERDLRAVVDPDAVQSADDLRSLPLPGGTELGDIAEISEEQGPTGITRTEGQRSAEVTAAATATDIGAVTAEVDTAIAELEVPDGVTVEQGGESEEITESFSAMLGAMGIAVALVYLVLVASFGSLLTPFVILLTLPLAAIGAFPALAITGRELGLPALIGLLMLIGIVVTNAIVLLEFVEQRKRAGLTTRAAVMDAAETRVRPILMTALTTMTGLVPLALGLSEGALLSASLATVVIGGLLTSTLLTLLIIPVVYDLLDGLRSRFVRSDDHDEVPDGEHVESTAVTGR